MSERKIYDVWKKLAVFLALVVVIGGALFLTRDGLRPGGNIVTEPRRAPDIRGLVDEWQVYDHVAQARVEIEKGVFRNKSFVFSENSKIGKGGVPNRNKEKSDRVILPGTLSGVQDHMFVEVYFTDPGRALVDTLVYWE